MARKKLQYQAISNAIFIPAAVVVTTYVGPFTPFDPPILTKQFPATQQQSVVNAPFVAAQQTQPFSQFSQPQIPRVNLPDEQPNPLFEIARPTTPAPVFGQFSQPLASRTVLPVEQPSALFEVQRPVLPTIVFTQFSQPQFSRTVIADEQPSTLFEITITPLLVPPFTGFSRFEGIVTARFNVALHSTVSFIAVQPVPIDTHDGVWVKRKKKRSGPDPIELEIKEKANRRAALELAVYGPEVIPAPVRPVQTLIPPKPPDVADLTKVVLQARQAHLDSIKRQFEADDEDDLESILKDIL